MIKHRGIAILSILVSAGLLVWLLGRIDLLRAGRLLREANAGWLLLAGVFTISMPFCTTFRWLGVLRAQDQAARLPFRKALRAVMTANVLNSFMPSKAGDLAKAVYLRKQGGLSYGVGTVLLERMVDLCVLGMLGLLGWIWSGARWGMFVGVGLLGVVACAFTLILILPAETKVLPARIAEKMQNFRQVFRRWICQPAAIAQTVAGSLANWSMAGLTICALVSALGRDIGWGYAFSVFPLGILAGLVPLTVSGIGARDSVLVFLLGARMAPEEATLVGIGYTFFAYWLLSLVSFPAVAWEIGAYLKKSK